MPSKKYLVQLMSIVFISFLGNNLSAQVAIATDGSSPDNSSMLHVKSTNKGFLAPRMLTGDRINIINPANGLLVYDLNSSSFWFYKAGTGWKEITSSQWVPDNNGIYYNQGNVGIGTTSANPNVSSAVLTVKGGIDHYSDNVFQTVTRFRNTTNNQEYQINLGGITNNNGDFAPRSFGIYNGNLTNWLWNSDGTTSYLAIGSYTYKQQVPKSRLHVFNGDINVNDVGSGIIMKSPNGQCWRVTVSDTGAFVSTAIVCP
jgi:hypothetical protein